MPNLLNAQAYTQILWQQARPQVMSNIRDGNVYCPSKDFFENEFIPVLDQQTLSYVSEAYDCEDISLEANVLMNRITRDYVLKHNLPKAGNTLSVVCEVIIPAGVTLNGVTDGVHAPHTVVFDNGDVYFFEAQPSTQRLTLVKDARSNGVSVRELKP
jgi:hypothetical protein